MRFTYHYATKDYPGFPELSAKSVWIGRLTCGFWVTFIWSWPVMILVTAVMEGLGMDSSDGGWIMVAAVVALYFILKQVRKNAFEKLDKEYMEKVNALRQTDPQKYMEIARELQRRQSVK